MKAFVFAALLAIVASAPAARADEAASARVDKIFSAWDKTDSPGASVLVVQDGKVVHAKGYGMAQPEYGARITPETPFHVASVSKQFTAFAIQLLVQEGKLSLDDEVRKHVPELQLEGPPVTVRQLVHHTSGLRDQWSLLMLAGLRLDDVITEGDLLGIMFQQKQLNFAPGEEELYSNSGYTLLGLIVKRVSGMPLPAFAKARIFDPLGMTHTHFQDNYGVLVPGRAYSYAKGRDGTWRYVALSYSNVGATSLMTTTRDLALWDANFYDAKVGGPAVQAAMLARGKLNSGREINYASGLSLGQYRGLPFVEHTGSDAGFRADILRLPAQRFSVIVLGNAAELNAADLARKVADVYLEGAMAAAPARTLPVEVELDARDLRPFVGDFEMRPGFVLAFTAEGNRLYVQATGQQRYELFASAPDQFFTKAFESSVTFGKPVPGGTVEQATWRQNGRDNLMPRIVRDAPGVQALQACAGDFYSDELRTVYRLSERGGKLMLRYPRGEFALVPGRQGEFSAPFPIGAVVMQRNAAGVCESFTVTTGRVRNLRFARVNLAAVR